MVLKSARPDLVVDGLYRQLKKSASSQFSGARPAVPCVHLRDITALQLSRLAREPINGLAVISTRLFRGEARKHLAGVSFVTPSGSLSTSRNIHGDVMRTSYRDVGRAYVFTNPKNPSAGTIERLFDGVSG